MNNFPVCDSDLRGLIRRSELHPIIMRRKVEEDIVLLVNPSLQLSDSQWDSFCEANSLDRSDSNYLQTWLSEHGNDERDLRLKLLLNDSLRLFMEQRYGPGLEEYFLQRKNDLDTVIYSLLRVRDAGLARELWISLAEGEVSFADIAFNYSDGPESKTKGVIGPLPLGSIEPAIAERLRLLRVGDIRPPERVGEWHVMLRLESFNPSQLDSSMRLRLLQEQFDVWIKNRVHAILAGETPEPLHYDPEV